jgi:AcrR family transcriptional regulator
LANGEILKVKTGVALRGEALREQILWAAREVFLEAGFDRASMDVVASRAGTTKKTVYAHFDNKGSLLKAVFEMLQGYFLSRLSTPDVYSKDPELALVLFCGRFLEKLLYKEAIRMCRMCAAEAERFPEEAGQFCDVVFTEVECRLADYLGTMFQLSPKARSQAAQRLLGQVLHPRFPRALFGASPLIESFSENDLSADFDIKPIRKAVAELMVSLPKKAVRKV